MQSLQGEFLSRLYWTEKTAAFKRDQTNTNKDSTMNLEFAELSLFRRALNLTLIDPASVIGIGSESIVVLDSANDRVSKYMFRLCGDPEENVQDAKRQYDITKQYLGDIAVDTTFSVSKAKLFSLGRPVSTVVQEQPYLAHGEYTELFTSKLFLDSVMNDVMQQDLERLAQGWRTMHERETMYPDISKIAGNLLVRTDGAVRLIDVLPLPVEGLRLVGDDPPRETQYEAIQEIEAKIQLTPAA